MIDVYCLMDCKPQEVTDNFISNLFKNVINLLNDKYLLFSIVLLLLFFFLYITNIAWV